MIFKYITNITALSTEMDMAAAKAYEDHEYVRCARDAQFKVRQRHCWRKRWLQRGLWWNVPRGIAFASEDPG